MGGRGCAYPPRGHPRFTHTGFKEEGGESEEEGGESEEEGGEGKEGKEGGGAEDRSLLVGDDGVGDDGWYGCALWQACEEAVAVA